MLPSFVIGLREGLEAALIVSIIAAFLRKQGRRDLLRWVLVGVGVAIVLCLAAGIALDVYSRNLPQRQQEGLETVIAVLAVGMVTYMVVWMRRHSRDLKGQLEGLASEAMAGTSNAGRAMVAMAFLAVIREGLETVVFLLAAFNETSDGATAGFGALFGIVIAVALGYGIYRGGVRLNLSKFFRATGAVLVLVAAGLVVNALHTAHEAGWLDAGQGSTVDLTWLVSPGSVQASLLTGMLGLQPRPVVVEVVAWLLYLIPVGLYVIWPPGRPAPVRTAVRVGSAVAVLGALAAVALSVTAPAAPSAAPVTQAGQLGAQVLQRSADSALVRTTRRDPLTGAIGGPTTLRMTDAGGSGADGSSSVTLRVRRSGGPVERPATLSPADVAALNGGRLPVGIQAAAGRIPVTYRSDVTVTVRIDEPTSRVLDVAWRERVTVTARTASVTAELGRPVADKTVALPAPAVTRAETAARADHATAERRSAMRAAAEWCVALAALGAAAAAGFWLLGRRTVRRRRTSEPTPTPDLVEHPTRATASSSASRDLG